MLATRPWGAWTFEQVAKKAAELTDRHPAAAAWLASVVVWSEAVRSSVPALADAMDTRLAGLADALGVDVVLPRSPP